MKTVRPRAVSHVPRRRGTRPHQPRRGRPLRAPRRPVTIATGSYNPLRRSSARWQRRLGLGVAALGLSAVVHGATLLLGMATSPLVLQRAPEDERIRVDVTYRPPPPQEPASEVAQPERLPKPPRPKAPAPPPAPKSEPKPSPPPVADPIDIAPPAKPASAPRRRIVGISFESTVSGGGGGAFAVGNTRMGVTADRAEKVDASEKLAPPRNRKAAFIPETGVRISKPQRRIARRPPYPKLLRERGIEANVVVSVDIGADGKVIAVKVVKGAAEPAFDAAAVKAAWSEVFTPATRNDVPIPYTLTYTYHFRLDDT